MSPAFSKHSLDASVACDICGITVSRKDDLARHMKLHSDQKEKLKICCPWDGCSYRSLQKSNVQTHIRTHTGEKLQCPSCAFATTDGGSLTRHRKRVHGYQPQPRRKCATGKVLAAKKSYRLSPYSSTSTLINAVSYSEHAVIDSPVSCPSPASSSLSSLELLYPSDSDSGPGSPLHIGYTFPWDKTFANKETVACTQEPSPLEPNSASLSPVQQFPAAGAGHALQGADLSQLWPALYPFGTYPTQPFESVAASPKYPDIHPAYQFAAAPTYENTAVRIEDAADNVGSGLGLDAAWPLLDYIGTVPASPVPEPFVDWNAILGFPQSASSDVLSPSLSSPSGSSSSATFSDVPSSPALSLSSEEYEEFLLACAA